MEFAFLIPNIDKHAAMSIINQFPVCAKSGEGIIEQLKSMCNYMLESNKESEKEAIEAYSKILDGLSLLLKKDDISAQERNAITDKMIVVADKIFAKDTEKKEFLDSVLKCGVSMVGGTLILGVNVKGVNLPKLKK